MQAFSRPRLRNTVVLLAAFGVFFATVFPLAPTPIALYKSKHVAPVVSLFALALLLMALSRVSAMARHAEPVLLLRGRDLLELTCTRLC
jgi:hypothetical protein